MKPAPAQPAKAKVFMSGRSQAVRIPADFRFTAEEVFIRKDAQTGNVILSEAPGGWQELFSALDANPLPDDFLADRRQGVQPDREEL